MLTIKELIEDLSVRPLSGEEHLDNRIRWIHISEIPDPTPWLSGNELLLTTGLQLTTERKQRDFIKRLVKHDLAGLGFGTGITHDQVPVALLDEAKKHQFPVFDVPYEVPFIALTEKAFTRLVNEQYADLNQALDAHSRLERVVLTEGGLAGIAETISELIESQIQIFDVRGELLVTHSSGKESDPKVGAQIHAELTKRLEAGKFDDFSLSGSGLKDRVLVVPVTATGELADDDVAPQAWLAAIKGKGRFSELDNLIFHQAVTIVALELLRRRVAGDTERRLAGNVLTDVITGDLSGNELARRLEPFGIGDRVVATVFSVAQPDPEVLTRCEQIVSAAVRDETAGSLVAVNGPLVCALLPAVDDADLIAIAERLSGRATEELSMPVGAGVGRTVVVGEARRAYHEARWAIEARALAGKATDDAPVVASYRDLGSFQLLLALQDDEALKLFCDSVLGPIEAGEGHYGDELLRSLEAFIEENGQWERAARRLYCHRHTLRYRVRKIEELTGRNLQLARDRIEFWLALRGRELVK